MYIIGHIILGSHIPDIETDQQVGAAYARIDFEKDSDSFKAILNEGESPEEFLEAVEDGDPYEDWHEGREGWHYEYHGGADSNVYWFGVELDSFDCTENIVFNALKWEPTAEQRAEAQRLYDTLPQELKDVLPPFDVYIVWSSS